MKAGRQVGSWRGGGSKKRHDDEWTGPALISRDLDARTGGGGGGVVDPAGTREANDGPLQFYGGRSEAGYAGDDAWGGWGL